MAASAVAAALQCAGGTPALPAAAALQRAGGTPALPAALQCAGGTPALPAAPQCAGGTPALPVAAALQCAGGTPALPAALQCAGGTPALPAAAAAPADKDAPAIEVVIVDYCKGNLRSVQKGFELAGARVRISADPCDITGADAVVLPGVGSFADAAATMRATGQMAAIKGAIGQGKPFLGICLGLQLMMEWGDEGAHEGGIVEGLGIIKGGCRRVDSHMANGALVKVPHVGWNQVAYCATTPSGQDALQSLFGGIDDGSNFYFTHSYQAEPNDSADIIAVVTHATEFASALACGMAFGVQFHPEKSSLKGLRVLENFVSLVVQHKASLNASLSSGLEMSHACI